MGRQWTEYGDTLVLVMRLGLMMVLVSVLVLVFNVGDDTTTRRAYVVGVGGVSGVGVVYPC